MRSLKTSLSKKEKEIDGNEPVEMLHKSPSILFELDVLSFNW